MPYSHAFPPPQGLYDPIHEHDACGVAFVATLTGEASHDIVVKALTALRNLDHRGAAGAEPNSGDGAGILMQVPDAFLREVAAEAGFELPGAHSYAVGTAFLPGDDEQVAKTRKQIEEIAAEEGLAVLGWRDVPVNPSILGATALGVMPPFSQLFVAGAAPAADRHGAGAPGVLPAQARRARDRRLLPVAVVAHPRLQGDAHHRAARRVLPRPASTSGSRRRWPSCTRGSRPTRSRAGRCRHPFRFIAHNGEINTVMGNRNWMRAREALLDSDLIPGDLDRLYPICTPGASDSASFDEVLELLHMGGRSLPHAVLMMIPEAWENHAEMDASAAATSTSSTPR